MSPDCKRLTTVEASCPSGTRNSDHLSPLDDEVAAENTRRPLAFTVVFAAKTGLGTNHDCLIEP